MGLFSRLNEFRRIATNDCRRFNIFGDDAAGRDKSVGSDLNAPHDHGTGRDPGSVADNNRFRHEFESTAPVVVTPSAEIGFLGDANMATERHRRTAKSGIKHL